MQQHICGELLQSFQWFMSGYSLVGRKGRGGALFSINILLIVGSDLKPNQKQLPHRAHPGISTGSNGLDGWTGRLESECGLTV